MLTHKICFLKDQVFSDQNKKNFFFSIKKRFYPGHDLTRADISCISIIANPSYKLYLVRIFIIIIIIVI
jgi:hypothetical protein